MESKYLGRVFDGFEIVNCYKKNDYRKQYIRDSKPVQHNAYNFELYNKTTEQHLTLSGNQVRLLNNGKRTIKEMLNTKARGSKNNQISRYLKWLRQA